MRQLIQFFQWFSRLLAFFLLLGFALNNLEEGTLHFFMGLSWKAPMALIVLAIWAFGAVSGTIATWFIQRKAHGNTSSKQMISSTMPQAKTQATHHGS